jgi:hypothetical protein
MIVYNALVFRSAQCAIIPKLTLRPSKACDICSHRLLPAMQATVFLVVAAPLCSELYEIGCSDNITGFALSAGTSPTCALLEHEFIRLKGLCLQ